MKNCEINKNTLYFAIFISTLVSFFSYHLQNPSPKVNWEGVELFSPTGTWPATSTEPEVYWMLAENLIEKKAFCDSPNRSFHWAPNTIKSNQYEANIARVPGYPFFIAICQKMSSWINLDHTKQVFIVVCSNYLFYIGIAIYSILLLSNFFSFSNKKLYLFIIILCIHPVYITRSSGIQPEIITSFFVIAGIFHYTQLKIKTCRRGLFFHSFFSIVFTISALMCRANVFIFIYAFFFLYVVLEFPKQKKQLICMSVVFIITFASMFIWAKRNHTLTGRYFMSNYGGLILMQNHIQASQEEYWNNDEMHQFLIKKLEGGRTGLEAFSDLDAQIQKETFHYIAVHPVNSIKTTMRSFYNKFMQAYFNVYDFVISKYCSIDFVDSNHVDNKDLKGLFQFGFYYFLKILEKLYLALHLLCFIIFPFFILKSKKFLSLYLASFLFVVTMAFLTNHLNRMVAPIIPITSVFIIYEIGFIFNIGFKRLVRHEVKK
jgi:hypothetical protein